MESQLRMTTWDGKESVDSDLERELHALQRERAELKAKCDALQVLLTILLLNAVA